jgi:hypothetical protein
MKKGKTERKVRIPARKRKMESENGSKNRLEIIMRSMQRSDVRQILKELADK